MTHAPDDHPLRPHYLQLERWAHEAEALSADQARNLQADALAPLLHVLPEEPGGGVARSIPPTPGLSTNPDDGRLLITFKVRGGGDIGIRTRAMLPVHFAILRAWEMVPGFHIRLRDKTGTTDRRANGGAGRTRTPDERIFHLCLMANEKPRLGIKGLVQSASRILFDAPPETEAHERYGADYHLLVPANYVLTKRHAQNRPRGRGSVRAMAMALAADAREGSLPYSPHEIGALLTTLHALADRFHGSELSGWLRREEEEESVAAE